MVWVLLAAAASAAPHAGTQPPPTRAVVVEARATVTILSGVRVKFDPAASSSSRNNSSDAPAVHDASVTTNGTRQPARLVEFE